MGEHTDKMKGTVKEKVGGLTNDERLEREGKLDRASGDVKEKLNHATDTVKEKVHDLTDDD